MCIEDVVDGIGHLRTVVYSFVVEINLIAHEPENKMRMAIFGKEGTYAGRAQCRFRVEAHHVVFAIEGSTDNSSR